MLFYVLFNTLLSMNKIGVSKNFKLMAIKAVLAILAFFMVYTLLMLLAIAFTALCAYGGIMMIFLQPMALTVMLGIGLISLGFLILFFLIKFIFSKKGPDDSNLLQIDSVTQPELMKLILETAAAAGTRSPGKVYLTDNVNAAVFYDSGFWSMVMPVKKNLKIGLGLINSSSVAELKAILAHEFGHFSQRSMKVGSYVYNVNKVLHNLLYDNVGYRNGIEKWANISGYFAIFVRIAAIIIGGIQWVLLKVYEWVNLNHLALSREMEFHADEVAAEIVGSQTFINVLLRLDMASIAYNAVLEHYNEKIPLAEKTDNLFPQHYFLLNFMAGNHRIPIIEGLPRVDLQHIQKINGSKLILTDQWSTHPDTEVRIAKLLALDRQERESISGRASSLLNNITDIEGQLTAMLFNEISFSEPPVITNDQLFIAEFQKKHNETSLPALFLGYYNYKEPLAFVKDASSSLYEADQITYTQFFNEEAMAMLSTETCLINDIADLEAIAEEKLNFPTYIYNGNTYHRSDSDELLHLLKKELKEVQDKVAKHDHNIFIYFLSLATSIQQSEVYVDHYDLYLSVLSTSLAATESCREFTEAMNFLNDGTGSEFIDDKLKLATEPSQRFKEQLQFILANPIYKVNVTPEMELTFQKFLDTDLKYFTGEPYYQEQTQAYYQAVYDFLQLLYKTDFKAKKALLVFQHELIAPQQQLSA